jgi:NAD-dependent dihydropyrimidine dehydrogenase PreA subunit
LKVNEKSPIFRSTTKTNRDALGGLSTFTNKDMREDKKMSETPARIEIDAEQCKGCELCVHECPRDCIRIVNKFNHLGYLYAEYKGEGCSGCGACFYACPEAGTITVFKKVRS